MTPQHDKDTVPRPTWDSYFATITELVSSRSTCTRINHGAVIVRDKHLIATGYNGSPPGTYHCTDVGVCWRQEHHIPSGTQYEKCRAIHAEQNALLQAAKLGLAVQGATMYVTDIPCEICAKMIQSAGIKRLVITRSNLRYDPKSLVDFILYGGEVTYLGKEDV